MANYIRRFDLVCMRYVGGLLNGDTLKQFFIEGFANRSTIKGVLERNPATLEEAKTAAHIVDLIERSYERHWRKEDEYILGFIPINLVSQAVGPSTSSTPPIVDNGAQYYNVMPTATRAPVLLLALPEPQLERRVEDLEKKIQAEQEGFQDSMMKQIQALTEQMAFMVKNQNSNTPPPRIESGNHNSGVWGTTCRQNGHSSLQCRVRPQDNPNPQPYQPTQGYGRDRGPQQRQRGYQGGPQGYGRSGKPRKEYHELCRRWHEPGQCWDDGQPWPCGNCGGNHPTHECRQPDKVIQLPPPITNPYENARNNMRDQRRPHGDDQRGLKPPNLYYNYEDFRQNHQPPEGLQTRQGYIPVAQNQQGGCRNYANQKQGPSSKQDVRVAEEVLLKGPAPSLAKTTVVIEKHEAPSNLVSHELKKDGGGGHENATLAMITRGQAHRQSPIDEKNSDSSESEELLDLVALEAAAKEAVRITREVGAAVGDERSSEGSDPGKGLEPGEWEGPDIPEEEFRGLGHTTPTSYQKYDLWRDLRRIKADISIAQLLEISPLMRKCQGQELDES
ncbi:uncharacterized protein [Physcomitrium patens]